MEQRIPRPRIGMPKMALPALLLLFFLLVLLLKSAVTVNSGEGGVIYRTLGGGVDTEKTLNEGFHIIAPWNRVYRYNTRQQFYLPMD